MDGNDHCGLASLEGEKKMSVPGETQQTAERIMVPGKALRAKGLFPEPQYRSPFLLVIFGASGDLTARKLIPSLYNLYVSGSLAADFGIVGCSRTSFSDDDFRDKMRKALEQAGSRDLEDNWPAFAEHLHYRVISYDSQSDFEDLAEALRKLDQQHRSGWNRIFYMAVPPNLLPQISDLIGEVGLAQEGGEKGEEGWARIVAEKPFGRDLDSALELDKVLHQRFAESQIFRIDHYLAKETVQNILMFRFANTIFEPIWNRGYIDYVGIATTEQLGVGHRAGYYEQSGVLRDMFQNHMMQMLAMTAMEPPAHFRTEQVRDEKTKVFRSLKSLVTESHEENIILGQYAAGKIEDQDVPGYRDEPKVSKNSLIPTFAVMRVFIDNWRWQGVPFYLASGKRLARKETRIVVQFKKVPHSMFEDVLNERITPNRLILGIYPEEGIKITYETKTPGPSVGLRSVATDFKYYQGGGPVFDAYEKVLLDIIRGEQMLFWREDGVEQCWAFLTPILEACEDCENIQTRLHFYEAGSWGPEPARKWMEKIIAE
jgi:glucose-6-phosphate 1-dehydrogenase